MGIIDIDGRTRAIDRGAFQPPAEAPKAETPPAQQGQSPPAKKRVKGGMPSSLFGAPKPPEESNP